MFLHLKSIRDHFDRPPTRLSIFSCLEAEPEVPRMFRDATEGIHRTSGVGFAVVLEPEFC